MSATDNANNHAQTYIGRCLLIQIINLNIDVSLALLPHLGNLLHHFGLTVLRALRSDTQT
jgi:hypothetical protein